MAWAFDVAVRTAWMEARGEGEAGLRAVCHVLANRLKDGRWGSNLALVCQSAAQFSCWSTRDPNLKACDAEPDDSELLASIAGWLQAALDGEPDPTSGSTHYYATSMILAPFWAAHGRFRVQIGKQRFYSNVP
jgi:N-acetylmuramoyl-L-alanine amidase